MSPSTELRTGLQLHRHPFSSYCWKALIALYANAELNALPPVSRCIEEARPYRPFFPLGAPDRD